MSSGMNGTITRGVFDSIEEMQSAGLRVGVRVDVYGGDTYDIYATNQGTSIPLDNGLWAEVVVSNGVTPSELITAQEDLLPTGSEFFKGNDGVAVKSGDTVPAGTTHLRVLVDGKPTIVAMSPLASGVVSLLTEIGATIGGTSVDFTQSSAHIYSNGGGVSAIDNMVEAFNLNPLAASIGSVIKTGGTSWQYKDSTGQIDTNNFRAMNVICVYDAGIKGDAYLDDGSLNPTPTDDLAAFEALIASVANKVGGAHIWIPDGCHMYMSDEFRVEYNTDNFTGDFDSENRRFAQLVIEGANKSGSSFIFSEDSVNGVILNSKGFDAGTVSLTSIMLMNVGIRKINFDPYEYQARPWDEDFDFSGEPLYGAGLVQRFMGYMGGVYNIDIDGFYIGHLTDRNYNGVADRIFVRNTIYGYLGLNNSVMNVTNSRYRGLQACFAANNGAHVLSNVVGEGLSLQFNKVGFTDLYDNFAGHGIIHYGGRLLCAGNVYTESNPGLARDIKDCIYHEVNGRLRSDIIFWYNNEMTQSFKDKVDVRNPDFKSIRITRTLGNIQQASIVNCSITDGERFSIVDEYLPAGSMLTPCVSVKGSLVLSGTVNDTIDNYFLDLIPRDLELVNYAPSTAIISNIQDATQVVNTLEQLTDYDAGFTVESGLKVSRLNTSENRLAKDTLNVTIDANGTVRFERQEYNTSGVKVVDSLDLSLQSNGRLSTKDIFPLTDNTYDIGRADFRYTDAFLVNNPTVGSDERIKKDPSSIPQELCDFVMNTEIKQYKLKDGQSGRYHYGIIVNQELLDSLNSIYPVDDCAALCKTIFDEPVDIGGVELGDMWQVRYAEWQNILLEAIRRKITNI